MPRFDVELLTPAFPGGYEQNKRMIRKDDYAGIASIREDQRNEVDGARPAAVVYGCRWWFRAIAGGLLGSTRLQQIRDAESLIFGTAQPVGPNDDKPIASRVSVTVESEAYNVGLWGEEKLSPEMKYLSYGLYDAKNPADFHRYYLKPGSRFSFRLARVDSARRLRPLTRLNAAPAAPAEPSDALLESLARLWVQYGGLGGRWRHGLGSMQLVGEVIPPQQLVKKTMESLQVAVIEVRKFLKLVYKDFEANKDTGVPEFPAIVGANFQIATREGFPSAEKALDQVVQVWREYRKAQPGNSRSSSRNARLYREYMEQDIVSSNRVEFAGLGMPIPFSFRQVPGLENMTGAIQPSGNEVERRASPIWFRVKRIQQGGTMQYGLISFLWNSKFLPDGVPVVIAVSDDRDAAILKHDPLEAARFFAQELLKKQRWNNR